MRKLLVLGFVGTALLAGCGGAGLGPSREQVLDGFKQRCESYGYKTGTKEMAQCVEAQAAEHRAAHRAADAAIYRELLNSGRPKATCRRNLMGTVTCY